MGEIDPCDDKKGGEKEDEVHSRKGESSIKITRQKDESAGKLHKGIA
jgi:hypothetical protein